MNTTKNCKKKLTYAGGSPCVLSFIALLVSAIGASMEFLGIAIYNYFFEIPRDIMVANDVYSFISHFDKSMVIAFVSLIVFIICLNNRRKKKIGAEFGAMITVVSVVTAIQSANLIYSYAVTENSFYSNIIKNGTDEEIFNTVFLLLESALPILSCFFLLLCGIVLWFRAGTSDFIVNCDVMGKQLAERESNAILETATQSSVMSADNVPENVSSIDSVYSNYQSNEQVVADTQEKVKEPTSQPMDDVLANEPNAIISDTKTCPKCASKLKPDANFCGNCGSLIQ